MGKRKGKAQLGKGRVQYEKGRRKGERKGTIRELGQKERRGMGRERKSSLAMFKVQIVSW